MNLVIKASGGHNIVLRPQGRATFYETATVPPAQVEVWWHYEDESPLAARLIGRYLPGQEAQLPYDPVGDKNIVLRTISISAGGVRSVRSLLDAPAKLIVFQRETSAPTVAQVGEATHTQIQLSITNYSQFATKRKIRWADDEAMTVNAGAATIEADSGQPLPIVSYLDRQDAGAGTRTIWVRVSHSSGALFGAESAAQAFTYADDGGLGGGVGEGDPFGGYRFEVN